MWDSMSENREYCPSKNKSGCGISCKCNSYMDKENVQGCLGSPMKQDADLSLYENSSPERIECDASPTHCLHQLKIHPSLEDNDNNSQDSGYDASYPNEQTKFFSSTKQTLSFSSRGSMDDDFLDICGLEEDDENAQLPGDFNKLITGSLFSSQNTKKSPKTSFDCRTYRRCISEISNTPSSKKVRSCLFKQSDISDVRSFKRPEPPTDICSPTNTKRFRIFEEQENIKPKLTRHLSLTANEDTIKSALQRSSNEPDLIGDFSKSFCLPLTAGRHQDLKSITPTTLALLLNGQYNQCVASYKIIDCRYPYEYNGGHIKNATNLYTKQQIMDDLIEPKIEEIGQDHNLQNDKRHILIFHCEFSSERGPNLSRFVRQTDRKQNKDFYPFLHYPEIYLLDGGYKKFYEQFPGLCVPEAYLPMLHPKHDNDLRYFRTKSKTFNNDFRLKTNSRSTSFKRI